MRGCPNVYIRRSIGTLDHLHREQCKDAWGCPNFCIGSGVETIEAVKALRSMSLTRLYRGRTSESGASGRLTIYIGSDVETFGVVKTSVSGRWSTYNGSHVETGEVVNTSVSPPRTVCTTWLRAVSTSLSTPGLRASVHFFITPGLRAVSTSCYLK